MRMPSTAGALGVWGPLAAPTLGESSAARRGIEIDDPDRLREPDPHARSIAAHVAADLEAGRRVHLDGHVVDEVVERGAEILVLASPDRGEMRDERDRRD